MMISLDPRTKNDTDLEDTSQWIRAFDEIGLNIVLIGMDLIRYKKHKRTISQSLWNRYKNF